ncbi:unnamed protein product [Lepeophtheirus salmonis]|uniref:(salmon louse) hypothetical protein n=1 Tax=Lepeophtheirus salmonis TaxID=72036 RepID=A0A7R8H0C4_LEPSM|nr:unnamed protein product [Lepeophtheirus salmonis]CAF2781722.1 unnamed protein product [Lepeophtheirus salmonis]
MVLGSTVLNNLFSKKDYAEIVDLFSSECSGEKCSLDAISAGKFISAAAFHFFKNPIGGSSCPSVDAIPDCIVKAFTDLTADGTLGEADISKHLKSFYFLVQERYLKEKRLDLIEKILPVLESFLEKYKDKSQAVQIPSHSSFALSLVDEAEASEELKERIIRISDTYGSTRESSSQLIFQGWTHFWKFYQEHERFRTLFRKENDANNNNPNSENDEMQDINPYITCNLKIKDEELLLTHLQQSLNSFKQGLSTLKSLSSLNTWFPMKKLLRILHVISEYFRLFLDHKRSYSALILVLKFSKDPQFLEIESCALLDWSKKLVLGKFDERLKHLCSELQKSGPPKKTYQFNLILAVAWSFHRKGQHLRALEILGNLLSTPNINTSSSNYFPLAEANYLVCRIQNVIGSTKVMAQYDGNYEGIAKKNPMSFLSESSHYLAYISNQLSNVASMKDNLNALVIFARFANTSLEILHARYSLYRKFFAGLQSRLYIKLSFQQAQELGAPIRIVESLLHYADMELSFDDETSASIKLRAVEYIMSSEEAQKSEKVSARRELMPKSLEVKHHEINQDTGASPLLVAKAFQIPAWGNTSDQRTIMIRSLSVLYISLQAWAYHLAGEIEMFKQFHQGLYSMERLFFSEAKNDETRVLESTQALSYEFFMANERCFECFAQNRQWVTANRLLEAQKKRLPNINKIDHPTLRFELEERFILVNHEDTPCEISPDLLGASFDALSLEYSNINGQEEKSNTPPKEKKKKSSSSLVNAPIKKSIPVPIGLDPSKEINKELKTKLKFEDEKPISTRTRIAKKKSPDTTQQAKTKFVSSAKKPSRM